MQRIAHHRPWDRRHLSRALELAALRRESDRLGQCFDEGRLAPFVLVAAQPEQLRAAAERA